MVVAGLRGFYVVHLLLFGGPSFLLKLQVFGQFPGEKRGDEEEGRQAEEDDGQELAWLFMCVPHHPGEQGMYRVQHDQTRTRSLRQKRPGLREMFTMDCRLHMVESGSESSVQSNTQMIT